MATFSWLWDSAYEGTPSNKLTRSLIDDHMRFMRMGVRERMEVEHFWGPYVEADTGRHRKGYVTVMEKGNQATRDALTNMQTGALFLMTDGSDLKLCIYNGASWLEVSSLDHGTLQNLTADTHTQYLKKAGGTMEGNIEMGGNDILMNTIAATQNGFVQKKHEDYEHSGIGNGDAIKDGEFERTRLTWGTEAHYQTGMQVLDKIYIAVPANVFILCPNFFCTRWNPPESYGIGGLSTQYTGGVRYVVGTGPANEPFNMRINFRYFLGIT